MVSKDVPTRLGVKLARVALACTVYDRYSHSQVRNVCAL
jgi:hypothetical protein